MIRMTKMQHGAIGEARRSLEDARASAAEAPRRTRDFVRRGDWLRERFPEARLRDVEGPVKLVECGAVESHVWSLTPVRYVGVAPEDGDEDFDFEEALRSIHVDHKRSNEEAADLAARIVRDFLTTHDPQPGPAASQSHEPPSWERGLPARAGVGGRSARAGSPRSQEDHDLGKSTGPG